MDVARIFQRGWEGEGEGGGGGSTLSHTESTQQTVT